MNTALKGFPGLRTSGSAPRQRFSRLGISRQPRLQRSASHCKPSRLVQNSDLGRAVELEELQPHFLRFNSVICHELQAKREGFADQD
jgi:hypothetical protein